MAIKALDPRFSAGGAGAQLFGAPTPQPAPAPLPAPTGQQSIPTGEMPQLPGTLARPQRSAFSDLGAYRNALSAFRDARRGGPGGAGGPGGGVPAPIPAPATGGTNALSPEQTALNNFANSAGMQFQLQQQANMLNNYYAGHGAIQSGAAAKALQDRGSQIALQNYFMPYMGLLGGQQAVGAGAASSIAGVGSNFGSTVAGLGQNYANAAGNINSNMGNAISQGALNIGNANAQNAAIGGLANANMFNTIGGQIGNVASSFIHPSY